MSESIAPFYADWAGYQHRIVDALRAMSDEELDYDVEVNHWPIWALLAHTAGSRVWWLCHVLGEPGMETTPFTDPEGYGREDDLATHRTRDEVVGAWESSWRIVEACLERWTPAMLAETVTRGAGDHVQVHTRQSILLRLITHEAYHAGEISLTLVQHGREAVDLWPGDAWVEDASAG
jgi:uncharacterized damage-inducible protein DinB